MGEFPEGTRPWGWGGPTHAQDGKHSKCTIFHTKCHFSCPKGIIFLSPVPCTNELFLLHFPTVSLPLLSLPAWLQCSFTCLRRPGDGHLQELLHSCNMPSFRFYRAAIKKTKYISKLISQIIYAAVLNKIRSILCTKLKASLSCKIEWPVISIFNIKNYLIPSKWQVPIEYVTSRKPLFLFNFTEAPCNASKDCSEIDSPASCRNGTDWHTLLA